MACGSTLIVKTNICLFSCDLLEPGLTTADADTQHVLTIHALQALSHVVLWLSCIKAADNRTQEPLPSRSGTAEVSCLTPINIQWHRFYSQRSPSLGLSISGPGLWPGSQAHMLKGACHRLEPCPGLIPFGISISFFHHNRGRWLDLRPRDSNLNSLCFVKARANRVFILPRQTTSVSICPQGACALAKSPIPRWRQPEMEPLPAAVISAKLCKLNHWRSNPATFLPSPQPWLHPG